MTLTVLPVNALNLPVSPVITAPETLVVNVPLTPVKALTLVVSPVIVVPEIVPGTVTV